MDATRGAGPPPVDPAGEAAPGTPFLPAGYEAQAVRSDRDPAGRFSYELCRVYGPPDDRGGRGPVRQLDEDRTYWSVSWSAVSAGGDVRPHSRRVSYAEARKRPGAGRTPMSFARFSELGVRGGALPTLLSVQDIA